MRVERKSSTPMTGSRRIISILAVSLLTAVFVVVGPLAKPTFAESVIWDGDTLRYQGNKYTREQPSPMPDDDPRDRGGEVAYTWVETLSSGDRKAYTIYFENDGSIQAQDTATLITYDYTPPDTYENPSSPQELTTKVELLGDTVDNDEGAISGSTCSGDVFSGLGWLLCPTSNLVSRFVDGFYNIIKQFLEVPLLSNGDDSGIYELWKVMRTISNVAFVIAFMIIIYSQITSIGISAYSIRAMLPRLIIAAILVNISYWLCALAIDISNLVGNSLQSIMVGIRENINLDNAADLTWGGVTNWILAGGGVALLAGSFVFTPTISTALPALGFLILSALISAAFALFVAFVILAARQAIITVLVVLAPLAFVAYILPNTEEYFTKWRKSLTTLLIFFPVFSLLFGGSQLAGTAIIQRGMQLQAISVMILGLAVQIVPLVITPLLIKFSSGLLGTIANMTNSSAHGPLDRMKNWANSNAEYQAGKKRAAVAQKMNDPNASKWSRRLNKARPASWSVRADQMNRKRESAKSENEKYLEDRAEEERLRLLNVASSDASGPIRGAAERSRARHRDRISSSADLSETSGRFKTNIEGVGKEMAAARLDAENDNFDLVLHDSLRKATETSQSAENMSGKFNAIIQEWKAGENGYTSDLYDSLSDDLKDKLRSEEANKTVEEIGKLTFAAAQQEKRKSSADVTIKERESAKLKDDHDQDQIDALKYAGGIDELGRYKVMARANSEAGALHMENVKAYDSVYSNEAYSVQEMMDVVKDKKMRGGQKGEASELQVHAAIQRILTKTGNNWSAQKVVDMVSEQGMQIATIDGEEKYVDANGQVIGTGEVNDTEVTRRRELQQILRDSIQQSKLQIKYVSNTEQSKMEAGLLQSSPGKTKSEELIVYDTTHGKYDAERIATADPDELSRMVQVYRDDAVRGSLTDQQKTNIVESIKQAQTNPNLKGRIKDRERGIMNILASYLDDTEADRSKKSKENYYYIHPTTDPTDEMYNVRVSATTPGAVRKQVDVRVPNEYLVERQVDYESGAGLHDPSIPMSEQPNWPDDWSPPSA